MAETVALLVAVGAGLPDQLRSRDDEVLVEVIPGAGEDTRRAGAPLETDSTVSPANERTTGCSRPVGETVLGDRLPGENGRGLGRKRLIGLDANQRACVAGGTVQRAESTVVVVLSPETVLAAAGAQYRRRLARRLRPPRLSRPLVHRLHDEQRPRYAPEDVVRQVRDVRLDERMKVGCQRRLRVEPVGDQQGSRLAVQEGRRVSMCLAGQEIEVPLGLRTPQLERPLRHRGKVERRLGAAPTAQGV